MSNFGSRAFLLASFAFVACDGSGSGGGAPTLPGASGNATEFCNSFSQAIVSLATRCYGGGEAVWRNLYEQVLNCPEVARLVAAGILVYDANQGRQCLATAKTVDCNDTGSIAACDAAVAGTIASGGACSARALIAFDDCAPGNSCAWQSNSCGGICAPVAKVGAPCGYAGGGDVYIECEDGSSCDYDTEVCLADAALGQACLGASAIDCGPGLYCDGDYIVAGVCRQQKTSGACTSNQECAAPYLCVGNGDVQTCQKVKFPGESCLPGQCMPLLAWCGADGKCTDNRSAEGQTCGSTSGDHVPCASGLYCDYAGTTSGAGTCKREMAAGATCTSSTACAGNGFCDLNSQTCVSCS